VLSERRAGFVGTASHYDSEHTVRSLYLISTSKAFQASLSHSHLSSAYGKLISTFLIDTTLLSITSGIRFRHPKNIGGHLPKYQTPIFHCRVPNIASALPTSTFELILLPLICPHDAPIERANCLFERSPRKLWRTYVSCVHIIESMLRNSSQGYIRKVLLNPRPINIEPRFHSATELRQPCLPYRTYDFQAQNHSNSSLTTYEAIILIPATC
jgi:hypothetical protein